MTPSCPNCGVELRPGARFCDTCGQRLDAGPQPVVPPAAAPVHPSAIAAGRYAVQRILGEGARKRVFLAHDTRLDRDVAIALIKMEGLDEAGRTRVRREAQAMARLGDDPHIVTVYDIGEDGDQVFIVSQYMAGGDLETLLQRAESHRLPLDQVLRIADQICAALDHAHARGIVHRDLKPGNVWLTADGAAKLGDFGLAVAMDRSRLTQAGMMVGTVAYMPPEQAVGRPPDTRSDLYSLGALLYEMVTGRPPFLGDDAVSVISQHINTAPVAPSWHNPDVPRALEALILRLLAKVPEERPESAAAVRTALETLAALADAEPATQSRPAAAINPLDSLAGGVFVGREREIEDLRGAVEDALAGRGRLVMLVGEPGIGKTRTADEITTYARLRGAQVLIGRSYEGEGAPVYWPWVQVVRSYIHDRDTTALQSVMGPGAADIAQVVSEVRERLPDLPVPAPLEPEQARFRLFDSITTFLRNAAQHQPLVLVLDDLHWADKPSLLLLHFLAREIRDSRLLIVGTYRDVELRRQHPLSQTLGDLAREQLGQRVLLRGLTERDVARFVEMTAGRTPPQRLVSALYKETEGNPFFVSEIVRLLVAEHRIEHLDDVATWTVTIPQSVRDVVGRRLDRLSPECNRALTIASVIGREFGLQVLEAVIASADAGVGRERLLDVLEEAVAARVITEVPRSVGRYTFSHALIRETLYGELTTTRRVRWHRRIGEVLEQLHAASPEPQQSTRFGQAAAELAYHFFEAAPGGDVAKAITYATQAGERATALLAYEEAVGHYERALQALELQQTADPARQCALLLSLGDAQMKAGETTRAKEAFRRAADVAKQLGAADDMARAALGFGGLWMTTGFVDTTLIALLEDALAALGGGDSAARARVMGRLAVELYWTDARERRVQLARDAIAMARRLGEPATLAFTLTAHNIALWGTENEADLLSPAAEIVRLAEQAGDRTLASMGREWRLVGLLARGDIRAVDREIDAQALIAEEMRQPIYRWVVTNWRAMRALLAGRLQEAEQLAEQAYALGRRVKPLDASQTYAVQMLFLRLEQGRASELEPTLTGLVEQYPALPAWRCGLALFHSSTGRLDEARAEFERLAAHDFADIPLDMLWLITVVLLSEVCVALGDAQRAAILYGLLLPCAGRNIVVGTGTICLGAAETSLGPLAATMGRWTEAERHFEDAMQMHRKLEAPPLIAHTQREYAEMLLARDAPGDRDNALVLLTEALDTARQLGMKPLVERAAALKLRAQGIAAMDIRTSIDAVASAVQRQRPDLRRHVAADGTVTLMFSDMEGFTEMTERLGDQAAHRVIQAHNTLVRREVAAHGGAELELQGDGFLLAFADPRNALRCAIAIQRTFSAYSAAHPEQPIRVRIGLHTGEAIKEQDRFFGKTVILAARIAAQAKGGEILVSSLVKELTAGAGVRFDGQRDVALKGLAGTYTLHAVEWTAAESSH